MPLTVLYFAAAREAAGLSREAVPERPADVAALRQLLLARHPALSRVLPRCRLAVNEELVDDDAPVPDGAEVAVIPPVSGGSSGPGPLFRVVEDPLRLDDAIAAVRGVGRGAIVTFSGDVRGETRGKRVLRLEYEAYRDMAERKLAEIGAALEQAHGAAVAIIHRVGSLHPGEAAVVIACAAPHRAAAFHACQEAIERLKKEVPVWKREVFEDGSEWVGLGP